MKARAALFIDVRLVISTMFLLFIRIQQSKIIALDIQLDFSPNIARALTMVIVQDHV